MNSYYQGYQARGAQVRRRIMMRVWIHDRLQAQPRRRCGVCLECPAATQGRSPATSPQSPPCTSHMTVLASSPVLAYIYIYIRQHSSLPPILLLQAACSSHPQLASAGFVLQAPQTDTSSISWFMWVPVFNDPSIGIDLNFSPLAWEASSSTVLFCAYSCCKLAFISWRSSSCARELVFAMTVWYQDGSELCMGMEMVWFTM
jgi:hypothetical protein